MARDEAAARRGAQQKLEEREAALEDVLRRRAELEQAIEEAEGRLRELHEDASEVYEQEGRIREQIGELKIVLDAFDEPANESG